MVPGSYSDGVLTATFDRKLDTGDKWDWQIVLGDEIDYIWSYHKSNDSFDKKHTSDGQGEVTIVKT